MDAAEAAPPEPLPPLDPIEALPPIEPIEAIEPLPAIESFEPVGTAPGDAATPSRSWREVVPVVGAVRLLGGYMHVPDEPLVFPDGDDALSALVLRALVRDDFGKGFRYEANAFADVNRAPLGNLGGAFATAGATTSTYRWDALEREFWSNGSVRGVVGIDRLNLGLSRGRWRAVLGRFAADTSVAGAIPVNDFFAPFAATAVNRIYKPGVDGLQTGVSLGALSALELTAALGHDDDGPSWGRSAVLARASTVLWNIEWAALGGKVAERWVAGASFQGDLGPLGMRGEGHVAFPDPEGDGGEADDAFIRATAGPEWNFTWHSIQLAASYAYFGDGTNRPTAYLARAQRFYPDDARYLARHYALATVGGEITPMLRANVLALVNASDRSGLAGASLAYSVSDEADLLAGTFLPWGGSNLRAMPPRFDEYGLAPLTAYVEARVFF